MSIQNQEQSIIEKLRSLPSEKVAEVEDFVDFLCVRYKERRQAASQSLEDKLEQRLFELGIISEIKQPVTDLTPYQNRKLIENKGKPISEVIIEERR